MATDWPDGTFRASPQFSWAGLVTQVLLAWGATDAQLHLEQAFRSEKSTSLCATVFVSRARELRKMPGTSGDQPTITAEGLDALGKLLLPKIEEDAANGTLRNAPRIWDIVRAWKYLGGAPEAKVWLNKSMSDSADFIAGVTEGLVSYTIGTEPRRYRMTERPDPDLYDLQVIVDAANKHLKGSALTEDGRNRVRVVAEAAQRQLVIDRDEEARKENLKVEEQSEEDAS
jgi:hypothetical protein